MACHWMRALALFSILMLIAPALPTGLVSGIGDVAPASVSTWRAFRGDASRTGSIAGEAPGSNDTLWSFNANAQFQSSPVFDKERVFVGSDNGRFYAIWLSNGTELWNRSMGQWATVQSTAYVENGVAYVGSLNGSTSSLYALNASNGDIIWQVPDDAGIVASPAFHGGIVYSGSLNGTITAVNGSTGKVLWLKPRAGEIWSSPAIEGDTLYCGTTKGELFALWSSNGTVRWNRTWPSGWTVYSTPAIVDGRVYAAVSNYNLLKGSLLALNATTGSTIWEFSDSNGIYSSPAVSGYAVYVHHWKDHNNSIGALAALPINDPNGDGRISQNELLWSYFTNEFEGGSSPVATGNMVLVGDTSGNLSAVNRSNGALVWRFGTGGGIFSSPGMNAKRIYVTSKDGRLYAIGSASELPALKVWLMPEKSTLSSNTVMAVRVKVVDESGNPVEGAYVSFGVTGGTLSQNGASTFPDGSQRVKYMAPLLDRNESVTLTAEAAKGGYAPVKNSTTFKVTAYESSYSNVGSSSSFNAAKYAPYIVAILALAIINIILMVMTFKRGWIGSRKRRPRSPPS